MVSSKARRLLRTFRPFLTKRKLTALGAVLLGGLAVGGVVSDEQRQSIEKGVLAPLAAAVEVLAQ